MGALEPVKKQTFGIQQIAQKGRFSAAGCRMGDPGFKK